MKKHHAWILYTLLGAVGVWAAEREEDVETQVAAPGEIVARGPHHRVVQRALQVMTHFNQPRWITNSYTELAAGLHYEKDGQWLEASAEIELADGGAVARKGAHQAVFSPNINTPGAIYLATPDKKEFSLHVLGLAYRDVTSGKSVMIAQIKDCIGVLLPPNQVVYADAFTDFKADLRYTYRLDGFEQDVIIRENPPSPAEYGLDPATTRLEVWTEFLRPPTPKISEMARAQTQTVAAPLNDQILDFGAMRVGKGRAFTLDDTMLDMPVAKSWGQTDGRDVLVESVVYSTVAPHLSPLPEAPRAAVSTGQGRRAALGDRLPPRPGRKPASRPMKIASIAEPGPGLVLDYNFVTSVANYTFDGTCYVSGDVTLTGTTTIRGGSVIKFNTNGSKITIAGVLVCQTEPYFPAVFTARDDNTVGETISGSTGTPSGYYAGTALFFDSVASDVKHLRFLYADKAIRYDADTTGIHQLRHAQILHCRTAVVAEKTRFSLRNALLHNVLTNFSSGAYSSTGTLEHVTIHGANYLNASSGLTLDVTNSILAGVTNNGYGWRNSNAVLVASSASGLFQTVVAGAHYLADPSAYRDAGTTGIDATLAVELTKRTTYPPLRVTNAITTNTVWSPRVGRDTDTPDLGYHYDAVDYLVSGATLTNATLLLTNGVAVGAEFSVNSFGLKLISGSVLRSTGLADKPNRLAQIRAVQENRTTTVGAHPVVMGGYFPSGTLGQMHLRFTHCFGLHGDYHYYESQGGGFMSHIWLRDCEFRSGKFFASPYSGSETYSEFYNNLWDRVAWRFYPYADASLYMRNNTFVYGSISLEGNFLSGWAANNLFDLTTIYDTTPLGHGVNAYLDDVEDRLNASGADGGDLILEWGPVAYQTGSLGSFYTGSYPYNIVNAGNTLASSEGLYHFTVLTNSVKETNTTVDIGYHYVATGTNGVPLDYDGDGVPDYWEDQDGNGTASTGEINWQNADTDGDGVSDGLELLLGRNPLGGTTNDVNNLINLRVFTPLK